MEKSSETGIIGESNRKMNFSSRASDSSCMLRIGVVVGRRGSSVITGGILLSLSR